MEPIAISVVEAGKLLGVSQAKAYQMAHMEGFPVVKVNGRLLVFVEGLRDWMRKQIEDSPPA